MQPLLKSLDARSVQAAISSAPIGAALIKNNGRFLSVNQALIDMMGAPDEQAMLDQSIYESGSYKNPKVREMVALVDSNEPEVNFDAQWVSAWGKQVKVRVFTTQLADSDGHALYQIFYENLLHRVDETAVWNSMLDASSNEFYVIHELTLKHLYANKRAEEQTGYSQQELLNMTPAPLCPEMTFTQVRHHLLASLETEPSHSFSGRFLRKDGTSYQTQGFTQRTIFRGEPAYLVIVQDVSEAMATDAALTQARLFLDSAPDPTVILNSEGTIVFANERCEALFGFNQTDLVGTGMCEIWPAIDELGSNIESGVVRYFRHRDESPIPVETSFCQIQTSNEVLVAVSCRDVSKRLATEQALKIAKEQAEHATQTKSRLLAAASHDLRQPTQSLSQYCWLLQQEANTPAIVELAQNIQSSVDSISDLLNALLDISKLESGVITPQLTQFDIASHRGTILSNYGPAAQAKGIALTCFGESCVVHSDPSLVLRIIENLVANAIRYTHFGGVSVSWAKSNAALTVTVRDTGIGIANDQIEKIFDEYYQVASDKASASKGLGLGLSIVQRVSQLLELPIQVKSSLGQGSSFSISLPVAPALSPVANSANNTAPAIPAVGSTRVLLIDDELTVLKSTRLVLERNHCTVHAANTAEGALQQLQTGIRPDVLITDYRLPGLSGTELVERAREALGTNIPAIIVTGDMSLAAIRIENLAPIQVLRKPTSMNKLISAIALMASQAR